MERRVRRKAHARCEVGEKPEIISKAYLSLCKTIVAIILAKAMQENGYQVAVMAPTGVLADQHYEEFTKYGLNPVLLTGKLKAKEKREIYKKIKDGDAEIVVGTHALLSDGVEFDNLALVIVDEEHRFGVAQRDKLMEQTSKDRLHKVSMSATPIPRSLANAFYGKGTQFMDIHTMPAGRKQTITCLCHSHKKLFEALYREIQKGRQAYIVCPFIEDSTSETMRDIVSAEACYNAAVKFFTRYPEVKIAKISGKMKAAEIDAEIAKFAANETQILISTTIVEVGVNVPNSSVMVIENAERFGLAQLHQLRGRVGRGSHQGYCVLMTAEENRDNERLNVMLSTTSGFKVAEADAKNRGIGDLTGEEQTGFTKIVELISQYPNLYKKIESVVESEKRTEKDWKELFSKIDEITYLTRANYAIQVCLMKDDI